MADSENERIRMVMNQPMVVRPTTPFSNQAAKPGPYYVCHRCGDRGHFIKFCPTNGNPQFDLSNRKAKKSTGIPNTLLDPMTEGTDPNSDVFELPNGLKVVRREDFTGLHKNSKRVPVPEELSCKLCLSAPVQAVVTRCCQKCCCYECVAKQLLPPDYVCPLCAAQQQRVEGLLVSQMLRKLVEGLQTNQFKPYALK